MLVVNDSSHNEKIIPLLCYNVPDLAVIFYKLNKHIYIAIRFNFKLTGVAEP